MACKYNPPTSLPKHIYNLENPSFLNLIYIMFEDIDAIHESINEQAISEEQLVTLSNLINNNSQFDDQNTKIITIYDHLLNNDLYTKLDENALNNPKHSQDLVIKPYQLFFYNLLSNNTSSTIVTQAFDVYMRIFENININDDNLNSFFFIDIFKSLLSLLISTYSILITHNYESIIIKFYKIWNISDKLLKNLKNSDDLKKKKLIMSLEYLINKYFNLLSMEIDIEFGKVDLSLKFFKVLYEEDPTETFYLKLLDNYLLFNIDNISKVYVEYINQSKDIKHTQLYQLLSFILSTRSESNNKLIDQVFINFLQTIISNIINEENMAANFLKITEKKYTNITVEIVISLLSLYKFDESEANENYYKVIFNIVNDLGYIITEQNIWKTIFDLISKDLGSDSTKNIFKTILTTDDIVNNLDFENIRCCMEYTNTLIIDVLNKQSEEKVNDDKILLNLFNYYWNINDHLNQIKEGIDNVDEYYEMWDYLLKNVFIIFNCVSASTQEVAKTIILNLYFNLINSSIVSVDSKNYTNFIKQKTIKQNILTKHQEFIENFEMLDLVLKETSMILNTNIEDYYLILNFYKELIKNDHSSISNEVYFVILKNYNLLTNSFQEEAFVNDIKGSEKYIDLKTNIYEIWLSFDLSLNNELIINEIKPNNKSLYDLTYEYMKMFPSIEKLEVYDETVLKVIEKCLKFPILPNNKGKDENNVTMLQRLCLNNIKIVIEKEKYKVIGIEILSNILNYKTELNKLISDKIFSKIPEKLIYRLPTFKKISLESLVYMSELFEKDEIYKLCSNNELIKSNLFKLITNKDQTLIEKDGIKTQSYFAASKILLRLINEEGYEKKENRKEFLTMFTLILENIESIEVDQFIQVYGNFSKVFFKNINLFQQNTEIYNQLSKNLVKLIVNQALLPVYDIFSAKLINNEEYIIDEFDPDNLWLDLIEQTDDAVINKKFQDSKSLDLIKKDIEHNKTAITKDNSISLFKKLLQLNDYLNNKYI